MSNRQHELIKAAANHAQRKLHSYIPSEPNEAGNPVFSVYQTDIICYGMDLASYLAAEFKFENPYPIPAESKPIRFWAELEIMNGNICNDTRSNL